MPSLLNRLVVAALLLGASTPALAGAGNGIRFGGSDGRLHPFVELEARYDSNVLVKQNSDATVGDVILHVRPGLTLAIPGDMTAVDFMGALDYQKYLGINDSGVDKTSDLSKLFAEARLGVGVNRKGTLGLELGDTFRRSDRPEALSVGAGVVSNYNALDLRLPWRPGGGALVTTVGATWAMETYERFLPGSYCTPATAGDPRCNTAAIAKLGYDQVTGSADLSWRFLPRTSASLEGSYFKMMPRASGGGLDAGGYRFLVGLNGLVTPHVATTLKAGYGSTTGAAKDLGTWLAQADVEWLPMATTSLKLSYAHQFGADALAIYDTNRVALDARQQLMGRLTLKAHAGWDRLGYSPGDGKTTLLTASPAAELELQKWMRAELSYVYTKRSNSGFSGDAALPVIDYSKSETWLKLVFTY